MFIGDQQHSNITRVVLEKVNDHYQGVCHSLPQRLLVGQTCRYPGPRRLACSSAAPTAAGAPRAQAFALERIVWTGKTPFEVHDMHARPDGFELTFTQPVDRPRPAT